MTTAQEEDIQPIDLIHWLYEDSLILEVCEDNYYGGGEEDLSIDCDLKQNSPRAGAQLPNHRYPWTHDRTGIGQPGHGHPPKAPPKGEIREASRQLQAPGSYDPLTIPHHPTTEMLLRRLLNQEGELKPGNWWMPESRRNN